MKFTVKSNLNIYSAETEEGRKNIAALERKYHKAFRKVSRELNDFGNKCGKNGYPFVVLVANLEEGLMVPVSNVPAEFCELFTHIMADGICKMSIEFGTTPDELLTQIQAYVEELKAIQAYNKQQEVSKP